MAFLRRKSGVYHEDIYYGDPEPQRQRRRLSKPLTNSSSSNLTSLPAPHLSNKKSFTRSVQDTPASPHLPNDSREAIRLHLFSSCSDLDLIKSKSRGTFSAYMTTISQNPSAQASSSQLSLASPTLPTYSTSRMISTKTASDGHKPSVSSLGSKDRYAFDHDLGTVSPSSSSENLSRDLAPPARRSASFTPGVATGVPITRKETIQEETESAVGRLDSIVSEKFVVKGVPKIDIDDSRCPPASKERCVTPTDLDVPHLGRLELGSLHVVNGRASPAPSEKSKRGTSSWAPAIRRETSSVYPESEIGTVKSRKTINSDWEDEPLPSLTHYDSLKGRPDYHRAFSFNPGSEAKFNKSVRIPSVPLAGIDSSMYAAQSDRTNAMAQEYISGLPTSPFAESPPPTSPLLPPIDVNAPTEIPTSDPIPSESIPEPATPVRADADEEPSSPQSTGSVRRHSDRAHSRRAFIDETLDSSPVVDRPPSPASFFSVPEPEDDFDAPFKSAVEIQPLRSGSRSPKKNIRRQSIEEGPTSKEGVRGPKSDSGYSSNTSLGTLLPLIEQMDNPTLIADNNADRDKRRSGLRFPFQKMQRTGKPVLVKPTLSTKLPSPKSAQIESASALTSTTSFHPANSSVQSSAMSLPSSPLKSKDKRNKLTKHRRKSTVESARELVVQRLASVECFNVPPVSVTTKANLAQRSQALPELDRTYRTQNHTANSTNASVLSLAAPMRDMRFPSPAPEEEEREGRSSARARSRGRSFSRPRSWFDWPKRDKSGSRGGQRDGGNSQPDLNDFGSVAELLGGNPYDIASQSRPAMPPSAWNNRPEFLRRRTSPSNISTNQQRPKSTMDDQTAAKVSKLRRRSLTEKDNRLDNRRSVDERGGIPWTDPHNIHSSADVPPLPPMPSPEEINRRWSYRHGYATHPNPLSYEYQSASQDENQYSDPVYVEGPNEAPPPPPHSPRPMYLEDNNPQHYISEPKPMHPNVPPPLPPSDSRTPSYTYDNTDYDNAVDDDEEPPPPPPSHSPRPMDITPQTRSRDVSWSSQQMAWRVRRRSAGEALQRSWENIAESQSHTQKTPVSRPSVIRRKPVPNRWTMYEDLSQPRNQEWQSEEDHQQSAYPYPDLNRQSMRIQHDHNGQAGYNEYDRGQHYDNYDDPYPEQYRDSHGSDNYQLHYNETSCYQQQQSQNNNDWRQQPQQYNFYRDYNKRDQQLQNSPQAYPYPPQTHRQTQYSPTTHHKYQPYQQQPRKPLAKEIHPDLYPPSSSPIQPSSNSSSHHPQQAGRYPGTVEYHHENFSHDFEAPTPTRGSNINTNTARGGNARNDGKKRSSWLDMDAYGVDFDLPVSSVPILPAANGNGSRIRGGAFR